MAFPILNALLVIGVPKAKSASNWGTLLYRYLSWPY